MVRQRKSKDDIEVLMSELGTVNITPAGYEDATTKQRRQIRRRVTKRRLLSELAKHDAITVDPVDLAGTADVVMQTTMASGDAGTVDVVNGAMATGGEADAMQATMVSGAVGTADVVVRAITTDGVASDGSATGYVDGRDVEILEVCQPDHSQDSVVPSLAWFEEVLGLVTVSVPPNGACFYYAVYGAKNMQHAEGITTRNQLHNDGATAMKRGIIDALGWMILNGAVNVDTLNRRYHNLRYRGQMPDAIVHVTAFIRAIQARPAEQGLIYYQWAGTEEIEAAALFCVNRCSCSR